MTFSIDFAEPYSEYVYGDGASRGARGVLDLAGDAQGFVANVTEWSLDRYRAQWKSSLQSLVHGSPTAVLITTFSSPQIASHLECWALYRDGTNVIFRNQLLFYDELDRSFVPEEAALYLPERDLSLRSDSDVSEWTVPLAEIREFVQGLDA